MQYPKLSKTQHNQALHRHNGNNLIALCAKFNKHVLVVLGPGWHKVGDPGIRDPR